MDSTHTGTNLSPSWESRSRLAIPESTTNAETVTNEGENKRSKDTFRGAGATGRSRRLAKRAKELKISCGESTMGMKEDKQIHKKHAKVEQSVRAEDEPEDLRKRSDYHEERGSNSDADCGQTERIERVSGCQEEASKSAGKPENEQKDSDENKCGRMEKTPVLFAAQTSKGCQAPSHHSAIHEKRQGDHVEDLEMPVTSQSSEDPLKLSDMEMARTSGEVSSSVRGLELESESVGGFSVPVEEKGVASFLDSCQEAGTWDCDVTTIDQRYVHSTEHQKAATAAGFQKTSGSLRLKTKERHECSIS